MIGLERKRHLFGAKILKRILLFSGIDISKKCQQIELLRMCKSKKMTPRHSAYIPSSVKIALRTNFFCIDTSEKLV